MCDARVFKHLYRQMLVLQVPPQSSQREAPFGAKQLFPALTALSVGRWLTDKELQSLQVQRTGITNRKKTGEELTSSNILRRIWEHTSSAAQSLHVANNGTYTLVLVQLFTLLPFYRRLVRSKKKKLYSPHRLLHLQYTAEHQTASCSSLTTFSKIWCQPEKIWLYRRRSQSIKHTRWTI